MFDYSIWNLTPESNLLFGVPASTICIDQGMPPAAAINYLSKRSRKISKKLARRKII
jgi:hypothetical protein